MNRRPVIPRTSNRRRRTLSISGGRSNGMCMGQGSSPCCSQLSGQRWRLHGATWLSSPGRGSTGSSLLGGWGGRERKGPPDGGQTSGIPLIHFVHSGYSLEARFPARTRLLDLTASRVSLVHSWHYAFVPVSRRASGVIPNPHGLRSAVQPTRGDKRYQARSSHRARAAAATAKCPWPVLSDLEATGRQCWRPVATRRVEARRRTRAHHGQSRRERRIAALSETRPETTSALTPSAAPGPVGRA